MADRQLAHAPYLSVLAGLSSTELAERQIAVERTMNTAGWVILTELWAARERDLHEELLRLPAGSPVEKYAAAVAHILGAREAVEASSALAKVAGDKRQEALKQ